MILIDTCDPFNLILFSGSPPSLPLFKLFIGLTNAAFIAWKLTVASAIQL